MNTADFIRGLDILMDYYDKRDSYHLGAEHDVIYAYATDRPLSPGDLQRVIDFGFHQEGVETFEAKHYDPSEGWAAYV